MNSKETKGLDTDKTYNLCFQKLMEAHWVLLQVGNFNKQARAGGREWE